MASPSPMGLSPLQPHTEDENEYYRAQCFLPPAGLVGTIMGAQVTHVPILVTEYVSMHGKREPVVIKLRI